LAIAHTLTYSTVVLKFDSVFKVNFSRFPPQGQGCCLALPLPFSPSLSLDFIILVEYFVSFQYDWFQELQLFPV
jgi:hypothetical protein